MPRIPHVIDVAELEVFAFALHGSSQAGVYFKSLELNGIKWT